ncbi:MAG: DNA-binding protein [Bacteroidales bacterium]|nr:DNA-binding protein [Bacteroidales bacterium]
MKTIKAIIERGNDGLYAVYTDSKESYGFNGFGETAEEAKKDFFDAYNEFLNKGWCNEELDFAFVYDTSSFLQLFKDKLSLSGLQAITGINRKQLNHYVTGVSKPSKKTVQKMQTGLHHFQEELSRIQLI